LKTEATVVAHSKTDSRPVSVWLPAIAIMLSATLEMLDTPVVNVSLPRMAGSLSATVDEVIWELTP